MDNRDADRGESAIRTRQALVRLRDRAVKLKALVEYQRLMQRLRPGKLGP